MSQELRYTAPRNVKAFKFTADQSADVFPSLGKIGIGLSAHQANNMLMDQNRVRSASGMDALVQPTLPVSAGIPVQFLQTWLPGWVEVATTPILIDELTGISTVGRWEDEEIIQGQMELTGTPRPYGDYQNIPLSSWNANYERRTVVRFEEGLRVGKLEEARASLADINSVDAKRRAATKALNIVRNRVGFYGFNSTNVRTYGFLNDPNLPAYVTVATGASSSTLWSSKTFLEITADIREAMGALRTQSGDLVDPDTDQLTLAVASDAVTFLSITNTLGSQSVRQWLRENFPNLRVVAVPQLSDANGGASVFYLYADTVADTGTDDGRVFTQLVPSLFQMLGSEQHAKYYLEDYTNATAGVMVKRPYAVVRRSGI